MSSKDILWNNSNTPSKINGYTGIWNCDHNVLARLCTLGLIFWLKSKDKTRLYQ